MFCDGKTGSGSPAPDVMPMDPTALEWLVEQLPQAVVVSDGEGFIRQINAKARALFGYIGEDAVGHPVELLVPEHSQQSHEAYRRKYLKAPAGRPMGNGRNLWALHRDGRKIPVEVALTPVRLDNSWAIIVSLVDLSAHYELQHKLRQERDFSNAVIDGLPAVFYVLDDSGRFIRWNHNFKQVTGLGGSELTRINAVDLFAGEDQPRVAQAIKRVFETGSGDLEAAMRGASGAYIPHYFTGLRVELNGQPCLTGTGFDISARKQIEAELHHQAHHDSLTGLMSWGAFDELLPLEVQRARRYGSPLSLIMCDIDHFKSVNDRHGHATGDEILCQVADTLEANLRGSDVLIRWGGEEFLALLPETKAEDAGALAETLRALLARTRFPIQEQVTASLGVTEYRPDESPRSLLKRVDDALYSVKESGRNRVALL